MSAIMSADQLYRYRLTRDLGMMGDGACCFVMLNPSTADATNDDPTIRRCIGFAKQFGCGRLEVVNLFAFRATNPQDLFDSADAGIDVIGRDNDKHIAEACNASRIVVCAWGNHGQYCGRDKDVLRVISAQQGTTPQVLNINAKTGQPSHPLYLPGNAQLRAFGA